MSGFLSFMVVVAFTPWRAFVFMKLWFWYLVPAWPMLAAPKWNLYGIMLIAGWFTMQVKREKLTRDDHVFHAVSAFVIPTMMLLVGWAIKAICL